MWAVGSGPAYTAVVWTGNPDQKPSADLVGSEAAGPLLFDVLEGVADRAHLRGESTPPGDLVEVEVCAYSGHIPTEACDHRIKVLAPIHAVPTAPCPYHQAYDVEPATGRAVLPACRTPGTDYLKQTFVVLPSAVTAWLAAREREVPASPVFAAGCAGDAGGTPPVMITPSEGQVVTLIPGMATLSQKLPLSASTRAATLTWFVDGALDRHRGRERAAVLDADRGQARDRGQRRRGPQGAARAAGARGSSRDRLNRRYSADAGHRVRRARAYSSLGVGTEAVDREHPRRRG